MIKKENVLKFMQYIEKLAKVYEFNIPYGSYDIYAFAKDLLDWLEKQGEPNPYSGVSFKYNGHTWGMCARDNGVEILVDGEIKERIFLDNEPQGKSALEAIKEEKLDNEFVKSLCVEPKFKVGDWIVWQNKCYKVNYNGCGYELIDQNGLSTSLEYGTVDKSAHLWTIQDAKDGDVLATSAGAFIYNGNNCGGSYPGSYCGIIQFQ